MNLKVKVSELLVVLDKNLETHRNHYLKAIEKWRAAVIVELDEMIRRVKEGQAVHIRSTFPVPEEHREDYRAAIGLLKMSVEDTIELSQHEYQTYVLDNWDWARSFASNTMSYMK